MGGESLQQSGHGRNQDTTRCRFPKINRAMIISEGGRCRLFWARETALPCPELPRHQNQRNRVFSLFYGCMAFSGQKPGFWPRHHNQRNQETAWPKSLQLIRRWLHLSSSAIARNRASYDYFGVGKRHCRVRLCLRTKHQRNRVFSLFYGCKQVF